MATNTVIQATKLGSKLNDISFGGEEKSHLKGRRQKTLEGRESHLEGRRPKTFEKGEKFQIFVMGTIRGVKQNQLKVVFLYFNCFNANPD